MAGIPLAITAFVIVSFILSWRQYWRATGIKFGGISALFDAFSASASLRYLGGDNAGGSRVAHPAMTGPAMPVNITIT